MTDTMLTMGVSETALGSGAVARVPPYQLMRGATLLTWHRRPAQQRSHHRLLEPALLLPLKRQLACQLSSHLARTSQPRLSLTSSSWLPWARGEKKTGRQEASGQLQFGTSPGKRSLRVSAAAAAVGGVAAPVAGVAARSAARVAGAKVRGKTVVVTGGSEGCGRETALLFAKKGYNVVVVARTAANVEAVAAEVAARSARGPDGALAITVDITSPEAGQAIAAQTSAKYDRVDVLINNAGVCFTGSVEDTPMDAYEAQMRVNFFGHVCVTRALLPSLLSSRGSIVAVNSFAAAIPLARMSAYCASKFALNGFMESLREEMAPKGVHVGQVHPGVVKTGFLKRAGFVGASAEESRKSTEQLLKSNVPQSPEEIANAVWDAVEHRKREVIVGPIFSIAAAMYRMTAFNSIGKAK